MLEVANRPFQDSRINTNYTHSINGDLVTEFINYIDVSENTVKTYARGLKQFFKHLANTETNNPTRSDILSFKDTLKERGLKANTIQLYIISVRRFFEWANVQGYYPNIAEGIKGAKVSNDFKKDYLTAEQLSAVFKGIDTETEKGARDYAMIALMATAGLRTVEVSRANITNLDDDRLYIQGKGRDEADEYIKLSSHVKQLLVDYLSLYRQGADIEEALFTSTSNNNKGARMTPRAISGIAKEAFRSVGIDSDKITAHSLRHSTATLNLLNGGSLEETQQLLRHESINTTMVYLHHIKREENESEQRISNAIFN